MKYAWKCRLSLVIVAGLCVAFLSLTGCGVVRGIGQAFESVGAGIADDAETLRAAMAKE